MRNSIFDIAAENINMGSEAKTGKERLEKWYDELYQMILLAFLLMDYTKRVEKIKELKGKINTPYIPTMTGASTSITRSRTVRL